MFECNYSIAYKFRKCKHLFEKNQKNFLLNIPRVSDNTFCTEVYGTVILIYEKESQFFGKNILGKRLLYYGINLHLRDNCRHSCDL